MPRSSADVWSFRVISNANPIPGPHPATRRAIREGMGLFAAWESPRESRSQRIGITPECAGQAQHGDSGAARIRSVGGQLCRLTMRRYALRDDQWERIKDLLP